MSTEINQEAILLADTFSKQELIEELEELDETLERDSQGVYKHWDKMKLAKEIIAARQEAGLSEDGSEDEEEASEEEFEEEDETSEEESEEDYEDEEEDEWFEDESEDEEEDDDNYFEEEESEEDDSEEDEEEDVESKEETEDLEEVEEEASDEEENWYDSLIIYKGKKDASSVNKAKTVVALTNHFVGANETGKELTKKELGVLIADVFTEALPELKMTAGYAKAYIDYAIKKGQLTL